MDDSLIFLVAFAGPFVVLGLWAARVYNQLVRLRNRMDAVWADIDVQLKRRHDLVPNLVNVVEAYAAHERRTLDEVTDARALAVAADSLQAQAEAETMLSGALGRLLATVEAYPDLEAEERFQALHEELSQLERAIAMARGAYNLSVQAYNNAVQTIPTNVVAWFADFTPRTFLRAGAGDAEVPEVEFEAPDAPPAASLR